MQAAGRIDDDDITEMAQGVRNCVLGNLNRVLASFFRINRHVQLLSQYLELRNRSRAVYVAGDQQRAFALLFQQPGQLACRRRLTGALQAYEHDDRRRLGRDGDAALRPAEELCQFVADNFNNGLGSIQTAEYFFAYGFFPYALDKIFRNGKVNVGFQQCAAHLFQRFAYVFLRQLALAAKLFEGRLKPF